MNNEALRELAEQKEKEWRLIQEQRIEALENSLKQKRSELNEEKSKFKQLKDDFKYNLKLLEERDLELEKYEQSLIATRKQVAEKNAEVSELKIKIDDLKKRLENDKNSLDECKKYYITRLNQKQSEVDKYKCAKDNEINQERSEIEKYKRQLQIQLQDLQFDLEKQRNELKTEFDEVMRKREHEWRLQTDEFNTMLFAKDLEIKMLVNELSQIKESNASLEHNTNETDATIKSLERKIKEKEWELKDTVALKDAKIKDVELKLQQLQVNSKLQNEEFNRKYEEMDKTIREKELCVDKLRRMLDEQDKNKIFLEEQINEYKNQIKDLKCNLKETDSQKEKRIECLNEEIGKLKLDLNKHIEVKARHTVTSDLNLVELSRENELLKLSLNKLNNDLNDMKNKFNETLNKQAQLENDNIKLSQEWQRRYENLERLKSSDSEAFVKQLMDSKNEIQAQVKILEEKLLHKENVIKALQSAEPALNMIDFDSNSEFQLREENEKLKQIIKQMREEMENLANEPEKLNKEVRVDRLIPEKLEHTPIDQSKGLAKIEFEEDLKRQLLDAKQRNRQLQAQLDDYVMKQKLPDNITDNTIINSHMKSMSDTINQLRKEKVDLTAFCKKQQTKLIHIEKILGEQNEQMRLKQAKIETLQYEMNCQARRNSTETSNLKQTIANLELELSATRREADEYHKATIEKNSEISSLENKISELKLKLSATGTNMNFGAQELFIQQLQDEIKRLSNVNQQLQMKTRQQHHELLREQQQKGKREQIIDSDILSDNERPSLNEITSIKQIESLKSKLKKAAKYISQLLEEKQHLIEMSNQLRGEINRVKYENENLSLMRINSNYEPSSDVHSTSRLLSPSPSRTALNDRLQHLEKKQYELTKKQLAFAQRRNITKSDPALSKSYKSSNYKDSESSRTSTDDTVNSSIKSENLKDIWRILDDNENDSVINKSLNDQDLLPIKVAPIKPIKKTSVTPSITASSKSPRVLKSAPSTQPTSARNEKNPKPKIRNYNLKD